MEKNTTFETGFSTPPRKGVASPRTPENTSHPSSQTQNLVSQDITGIPPLSPLTTPPRHWANIQAGFMKTPNGGTYRREKLLGEGYFSKTWKFTSTESKKSLVLKNPKYSILGKHKRSFDMLKREKENLKRVGKRALTYCPDKNQQNNKHCDHQDSLVIPFETGSELTEFLAQLVSSSLTSKRKIEILDIIEDKIHKKVSEFHQQFGLVHCDLKAENIVYEFNGNIDNSQQTLDDFTVKIIDLGAATKIGDIVPDECFDGDYAHNDLMNEKPVRPEHDFYSIKKFLNIYRQKIRRSSTRANVVNVQTQQEEFKENHMSGIEQVRKSTLSFFSTPPTSPARKTKLHYPTTPDQPTTTGYPSTPSQPTTTDYPTTPIRIR